MAYDHDLALSDHALVTSSIQLTDGTKVIRPLIRAGIDAMSPDPFGYL